MEIFSILKSIERGQKMYHKGKVQLFYCALVAGPIFTVLGIICLLASLFGLISGIESIKTIFGGVLFLIIAYVLKDEKNKNI